MPTEIAEARDMRANAVWMLMLRMPSWSSKKRAKERFTRAHNKVIKCTAKGGLPAWNLPANVGSESATQNSPASTKKQYWELELWRV
jgi:hypothetical protein